MTYTTEEQAVIAIRQITRAIDLNSKKTLKKYGLSGPQLAVLNSIAKSKFTSIKNIAVDVNLSSPTVLGILERLIHQKYVTKVRSEVDKRQSVIQLTEKGEDILKKTPDPLHEKFSRKFSELEDWEKNLTLSSLQRVASMLNADDYDVSPSFYAAEIDETKKNSQK